ncbi:dynamin like protein [Planoprotostelium fungivorum]|uniref:Dynamin like protein n=1 Tax=Planoprotostelium fungivorum TaxID=1890364 RepID=A0A2P6N9Z5_9EUKA|nr:dynamin like protein [Planoprotostelium fungivorum]
MFGKKKDKEKEKEKDRATLAAPETRRAPSSTGFSRVKENLTEPMSNSAGASPNLTPDKPIFQQAYSTSKLDQRRDLTPSPPPPTTNNYAPTPQLAPPLIRPADNVPITRVLPEASSTSSMSSTVSAGFSTSSTLRGHHNVSSVETTRTVALNRQESIETTTPITQSFKPYDVTVLEKFREKVSTESVGGMSRVSVSSDFKNSVKKEELWVPKRGFDLQRFEEFQNLLADISNFADVEYRRPEVIILGNFSAGKSHVTEALVGEPLNLVEYNRAGATKRPLFIHLVHSSVDKKHSFEGREAQSRTSIKTNASSRAKVQPNKNRFISDPVSVQMESRHHFDFSIVDTPGCSLDQDLNNNQEYVVFLEHLLRASHRQIVLIEDSSVVAKSLHHLSDRGETPDPNDHERPHLPGLVTLRQLVRRCDPSGSRTTVVFNKFSSVVELLRGTEGVHRFVKASRDLFPELSTEQIFYTSLLSTKDREAAIAEKRTTPGIFFEKLLQAEEYESLLLKKSQCGDGILSHVGLSKLRRHIVSRVWTQYQSSILPDLQRIIKRKKMEIMQEGDHLKRLYTINLKELVSKFASRYSQIAVELIQGTCKANPSAVGETLKEEIEEQYFSSTEWRLTDIQNEVPLAKTRVYGGQQFMRIISEFEALSARLVVPSKMLSGLPNKYDKNFHFHACELAKDRAEECIIPLIEQLHERLVVAFMRLPGLVESLLRRDAEAKFPLDVKYFRRLGVYLRTLVTAYVERVSAVSKSQCMEEFYPTKTIMWEVLNVTEEEETPIERIVEERDVVQQIFSRIRTRITRNVIRRIHNFFLAPLTNNEMWLELQGHIFCLDDQMVSEVLDAGAIREEVQASVEGLDGNVKKMDHFSKSLHALGMLCSTMIQNNGGSAEVHHRVHNAAPTVIRAGNRNRSSSRNFV